MARGARGRDPGFSVIVKLTDRFTKPIQNVNQSIARATAGIRGLARIPGAIAAASGLDKIGSAAANVGRSVGRLGTAITGAIAPIARLATIGAGVGLAAMTSNAVTLGAELVRLNSVTGISIQSLQEFQYAAKQSDVPVEALNSALGRLQKSVAAARKGNKEMVTVFRALGISTKELQTLSIDEVFLRVATAISNMTDQTHKAESATKTMGKSAAELLPLLNEGAPGIRVLGDALRETGAIMSDETARDAKTFTDQMTTIQHQVQGVAFSVLEKLLPAMNDAAAGVREWLAANREWLTTKVIDVIDQIVTGATAFVRVVRDDVWPMIKGLKPTWDALGAALGEGNRDLLAFAAIFSPGLISAIAGVTSAVVSLGIALVANPIGAAIVAIVAAIGGASYLIWKHWDDITAAFQSGLDWISETLDGIEGVITGAAGAIGSAIRETLTAPIEWVKAQWEELVAFFWRIVDRIRGAFDAVSGAVSKALSFVGLGGGGGAAAPAPTGRGDAASAVPAAAMRGRRSPADLDLAGARSLAAAGPAPAAKSEVDITARFENLPAGTRVSEDHRGPANVGIDASYAGARGALGMAY